MNTCGYCKVIKEELEKNNIEFENRLTDEWKDEWNDIVNLTNLPAAPTIYYKDSYFIPSRDFGSPQQLMEMLKNFKQSKFTESKQIIEKFKTLNYNMSGAFNRMEQLLMKIETKLNTKDEYKSTS